MEMLQKYLPEDMIIEIMSYLHFDIILKIDVPFKYFKNILISRCHNRMPDNWYKGMYNNMYHQCFKCERMMNLHKVSSLTTPVPSKAVSSPSFILPISTIFVMLLLCFFVKYHSY